MQRGFSPIFVIIGILILAGAAYYFNSQKALPSHSTNIPTSPSASPNDETINWKTYANPKYGYSFKYPSDWIITDKTKIYNRSDIFDAQTFNDDGKAELADNETDVLLSHVDIEKIKNTTTSSDAGMGAKSEVSITNINGKEIVKVIRNYFWYQADGTTLDKGTQYFIYIPVGENHLWLRSNIKNKQILDQILATFKFTNPVNIFLKNHTSKEDIDALISELQAIKGVNQVKFISEDEALKIYKEAHKNDSALLALTQPNILPASIEVYLDDSTVKSQIEQTARSKSFVTEVTQSSL